VGSFASLQVVSGIIHTPERSGVCITIPWARHKSTTSSNNNKSQYDLFYIAFFRLLDTMRPGKSLPQPKGTTMKKLMIPAIAALMSVAVFAEDAAKPADAAAAPADGACKAVAKGDDAMKFDIKEIKINKASCPEFTVEIDHVGKLPAAAMGHNVVIAKTADVDAVAKEGAGAAATNYVKDGDARVIAHTKVVGGGEKDSVTFKTDVLEAGGDYDFFCSFPGHYAVMRGKVVVE